MYWEWKTKLLSVSIWPALFYLSEYCMSMYKVYVLNWFDETFSWFLISSTQSNWIWTKWTNKTEIAKKNKKYERTKIGHYIEMDETQYTHLVLLYSICMWIQYGIKRLSEHLANLTGKRENLIWFIHSVGAGLINSNFVWVS